MSFAQLVMHLDTIFQGHWIVLTDGRVPSRSIVIIHISFTEYCYKYDFYLIYHIFVFFFFFCLHDIWQRKKASNSSLIWVKRYDEWSWKIICYLNYKMPPTQWSAESKSIVQNLQKKMKVYLVFINTFPRCIRSLQLPRFVDKMKIEYENEYQNQKSLKT